MRKFLVPLLIILTASSVYGSIDFNDVEHDLDPITGGETYWINTSFDNNADYANKVYIEIILEPDEQPEDYSESDFGLTGEMENSEENHSITNCSFNSDDRWEYTCPEHGFNASSGTETDIELELETPINMKNGSIEITVNGSYSVGEPSETVELEDADDTNETLDQFEFRLEGEEMNGHIATFDNWVIENASDEYEQGLFKTDLEDSDSIEFVYNFSSNLIDGYSYEFKLYEFGEEWGEIDTEILYEDKLTAELDENAYYSLYLEREELTVDDLIDTEIEIEEEVDGDYAEITLFNLGETEEAMIELPEMDSDGSHRITELEFVSNINDSAVIEIENYKERPLEVEEIEDTEFQAFRYSRVSSSDSSTNQTLNFTNYVFELSEDLFEFEENVGVYRFNDGNNWISLETDVSDEEGRDGFTKFESSTDGNSYLGFGTFESDIEITGLNHSETILDNSNLTIEVELENSKKGTGYKELNLTANGETLRLENVTVEGNLEKTHSIDVELEPGNHDLILNDQSSEVTVEERSFLQRTVDATPLSALQFYALLAILTLILSGILYRERQIIPNLSKTSGKVRGLEELIKDKVVNEENSEEEKTAGIEDKDEGNESSETSENTSETSQREEVEGDFMCSICGEDFDTSEGLELHHEMHEQQE